MASNDKRQNVSPNETSFETISGLKPDVKRLPYRISTADVEKFLRRKVALLQNQLDKDAPKIEVTVYSSEASRLFVPFVVLLSMDAVDSKLSKKIENYNADPFFSTERDYGNRVNLKDYVYKFFKGYMYQEEDIKAFSSEDYRRARGISRQTSSTLKRLARPTIAKGKNNREVVGIYFLINPLAVFYDMLRFENDNKPFQIIIEEWHKQDSGTFVYDVLRKLNGKTKGKGKSFIDELDYRMRSGNR